jgi:hypothetical protein
MTYHNNSTYPNRFIPHHQSTHSRSTCNLHPILDETPCTITSFCNAVDTDLMHKRSKIIWAKASIRKFTIPIDDERHLTELRDKLAITNKFVAVSWIGTDIENTCVLSLTPMVITPLFLDSTPQQVAQIMWERGDEPIWGPITYIKRLVPPKVFQGRVWNAMKRNRILCHSFLTKPRARIAPSPNRQQEQQGQGAKGVDQGEGNK